MDKLLEGKRVWLIGDTTEIQPYKEALEMSGATVQTHPAIDWKHERAYRPLLQTYYDMQKLPEAVVLINPGTPTIGVRPKIGIKGFGDSSIVAFASRMGKTMHVPTVILDKDRPVVAENLRGVLEDMHMTWQDTNQEAPSDLPASVFIAMRAAESSRGRKPTL